MTNKIADLQKRHGAELKAERDEVSRLKEVLKTMGLAAAKQKKQLEAAEKEIVAHKAQESSWLNDLNKVNHAMSSE